MYDLGGYPCILLSGNPADLVHGELYVLQEGKCRKAITAMEINAGFVEDVVLIETDQAIAFVYKNKPARASLIKNGCWRDHCCDSKSL